MEATPALSWPDGVPAPTEDAAVDRILGRLPGLRALPLPEQPSGYDAIHDELLAELDAEGG